MPLELHPEYPPEGVPLENRFPREQIREVYATLQQRGREFGISFGNVTRTSNSRQALQAAEYAREQGLFEPMHEALLKAFFSEASDIGDREVLLAIARSVGLDADDLDRALDQGQFMPRLEQATAQALDLNIRAAPTFVLENGRIIVGAQPLEVLRQALVTV